MRYLGASGAVLAAAMTFSLTPLGRTARASGDKPVVVSMLARNTIVPLSRNSFSTITLAVKRYMSPPTLLEGLAEINPATCTEIAVGAWTPSPDQLCGKENCGNITTGTETDTEGSGVCAGSTFTFATIYYEWTAHNNQSTLPAPPNSVEDTFNATWAAPDGATEQDTFDINVPVVRPDHETTAFLQFDGDGYGLWQQTLIQPLIFQGKPCENSPRVKPARTCVGILNQIGSHSMRSPVGPMTFGKYNPLTFIPLTRLAMAPTTYHTIVKIALFLKGLLLVEPDLGRRWKYTPLQIDLTQILHTGALIRET